jgi:hypothetical protein
LHTVYTETSPFHYVYFIQTTHLHRPRPLLLEEGLLLADDLSCTTAILEVQLAVDALILSFSQVLDVEALDPKLALA